VVCSNGKASEAAAFLLLRHKFNAIILKGGMESVPTEVESRTALFDIDDGIETLVGEPEEFQQGKDVEQTEDELPSSQDSNLAHQVRFLKSENDALRKMNYQLNDKCMRLEIEKDHAEKHCRMQQKQIDKLTQILAKLKES
jgi:hypothetical protein